jgi:hypothetical protein
MADPTATPGFSWNKVIAAAIPAVLMIANTFFGVELNLTPEQVDAISTLLALLIPAAVWLTPNRVTSNQAAAVVAATRSDPVVQLKADAIDAEKQAGA